MILAYYLSITAYCTPYNALIPELGHTQQERLNISTVISFTFIAGTAVAYLAPTIWGMFIPAFGRVGAIRVTFTIMAVIAFICMLVPVFCIREKIMSIRFRQKNQHFVLLWKHLKWGISQICRIRYFLLDCVDNVPDRASVFRYQSVASSGDNDNNLFCRNDCIISGVLHTG